jgi:uncharacterized protein (TIGR03437 family)
MRVSAFWMLAAVAALRAQPGTPFVPLDGVVNSGSYLPACSPNGGVAPGSLFAIFGRDIGPATLARATAFPLRTTLEGVSVRISMRGSTFDALPLYTNSTQIGAILPATVPTGDGMLTVTNSGRAADAVPIRVRPAAPGIFTTNQRGSGQAAVENVDAVTGATSINAPARALRPGQLATIWGTGIGSVSGDEAGGPLPGNQPGLDVRVWVGERPARVIYRGRSGCCAGIDQIVFETPAGTEGCQVPLSVEASGVTSNFGSIAISSSGVCAATSRLPPVSGARPDFRFGLIFFLDGYGSVLLPGAGDDYVRLGFFQRGRVDGDLESPLHAFEPNAEMPVNTCTVRYGTEFPTQPSQPSQVGLDSGSELRISGPGGTFRLLQSPSNPGNYEDPQRVVLPAGAYVIENGSGGRDVGAFSLEANTVTVKLLNPPDRIVRGENLTLTWDYQGPTGHLLTVFGSTRSCGRDLFSFTCTARASDRRFVVPARILSALPPTTSFFGLSNGALNLSTTTPGGLRRFTAPGLDLGLYLQLSISAIRPTYE